jgi:hypothetical protein
MLETRSIEQSKIKLCGESLPLPQTSESSIEQSALIASRTILVVSTAAEMGVLSRGRYGYVAKYRWVPAEDVVLILSVRHPLEAGYKEE